MEKLFYRYLGHFYIIWNFTSIWITDKIENGTTEVVDFGDPCSLPKACKNKMEINGMKNSHIRDGVAVCEFLSWLNSKDLRNKILAVNYASRKHGGTGAIYILLRKF